MPSDDADMDDDIVGSSMTADDDFKDGVRDTRLMKEGDANMDFRTF